MNQDEEPKTQPSIKVTDRRQFAADGSRKEVEMEDGSENNAVAESVVLPIGPEPAAIDEDSGAESNTDVAADDPPETAEHPEPQVTGRMPSPAELPRDLSGFIESQYFEALLYLGAIQHPQTGEPMEDVDMASYKIDILAMIQEKTEGNRTPQESKLLEDILYRLRMAFLQLQKVHKL